MVEDDMLMGLVAVLIAAMHWFLVYEGLVREESIRWDFFTATDCIHLGQMEEVDPFWGLFYLLAYY
jgi:hypothetical protein